MLEGYEQLEKLFEIINKWEKATGMACNKAKTAIIRMGATRRKEVPETLLRELKLPNPSEEPYEIYLGAPIGSDKTKYVEFIESKYRSIKSKLASYRNSKLLVYCFFEVANSILIKV